MAPRISSIFSIGSNYSDQTQRSDDSRFPPSAHPARPFREQSPAKLAARSTPDLRPTSNLQNLHDNQSSGLTPPFNPSLLPRIEDDHPLLQPSQLLSPHSVLSDSPNGSRPTSIASYGDALQQQPPNLLKPMPIRSESPGISRPVSRGSGPESSADSRPGSRAPSRPGSPIKSRPQTPTTEHKVSKRRSWLPGRSKAEALDEEHGAQMPQAWLVTPQETLRYDASALANFQKVRIR